MFRRFTAFHVSQSCGYLLTKIFYKLRVIDSPGFVSMWYRPRGARIQIYYRKREIQGSGKAVDNVKLTKIINIMILKHAIYSRKRIHRTEARG